jgi:hypothetical protein
MLPFEYAFLLINYWIKYLKRYAFAYKKEEKMSHNKNTDAAAFWICEKSDGNLYLYSESAEHYHVGEASRKHDKLTRLDSRVLGSECEIEISMPDNSYFVLTTTEAHEEPMNSKKKTSKKSNKKTSKKSNKKNNK